jgi:ATP-binding cassette, subfamily B, bacterial
VDGGQGRRAPADRPRHRPAIEVERSAWGWAVLIAAAGVVTGTFTALRRYVSFRESRLTETRLRERMLQHILGLHIGYHDRSQTGQLMSRASSDLNQVQMFVVMIPLTCRTWR